MSAIDLRMGRWQDVLADVECDTLISDPPYSERTHEGQRHGRKGKTCGGRLVSSRGLAYAPFSRADVCEFVSLWAARTRGWFCVFSDSELYPAWRDALRSSGRYVFAPIPCVQIGMNIRLAGDGPSNWTTWFVVSRPRALNKWGTLRGAYVGNAFEPGQTMATAGRRSGVVGGKPLWLMQALVRDYSRAGDLICDPCAGGGTTLLAAAIEGRRAVGAECLPEHYELARKRIARGYTPTLFAGE
jgi:site-specific DNA-methyltransferase (adenine-specific)